MRHLPGVRTDDPCNGQQGKGKVLLPPATLVQGVLTETVAARHKSLTRQLRAGQGGGHGAQRGPLAQRGAGHGHSRRANQGVVLQLHWRCHRALAVDGARVHQICHVSDMHPASHSILSDDSALAFPSR